MFNSLNIETSNNYEQFNNMTMYDSDECIKNKIMNGKSFLCLFNKYACDDTSGMFCLIQSDQNIYYKINIICDDNKGTHKNGQWYCETLLDDLDVLNNQYIIGPDFESNHFFMIGIPIISHDFIATKNYFAFITESWLQRYQNGKLGLPVLSPSLIRKCTPST